MRYANYTYEHAPSKFIMSSKALIFCHLELCHNFRCCCAAESAGPILDSFAHYFKQFIKLARSVYPV